MANEEGSSSNNTNRTICMERYEVGKVLGKGKFSVVKLACNVVTGDKVAIKIFDKEQLLKGRSGRIKSLVKKKIKQEISIQSMVKHPNVLRVIEKKLYQI
ncbi:CBL-interacting serine/threonine-protein kinase 23-like [Vigna unguiculata]|uniref:CBL-interacting serine/threonine-protein kinase 23-like n=1 Tax=Vigna unguiculata TaxID=3917 RepID=UPI001015E4D8|nr:CBL-interacting serine/threonine-protein kinase 23-like [Vigna unguiculata]